jgi:hypothetical protein
MATTKKRNLRAGFGKCISVQFLLNEEDPLIRELARLEDRSIANTVRLLALAEARRLVAQKERPGVAS